MPEWLIPIFVLFLIYLYLTMKTPTSSTEKPESKATTEPAIAPAIAKAKPKKTSTTSKAPKKAQSEASKPASKAKVEKPVTPVVVAEVKPSSAAKAPKKPKAVASKPATATTEMTATERAGLTAGSIWHYLADNGATPVAKLVRELPEDEKTIQRSIGWLAQEGKITFSMIDKVETIALKE